MKIRTVSGVVSVLLYGQKFLAPRHLRIASIQKTNHNQWVVLFVEVLSIASLTRSVALIRLQFDCAKTRRFRDVTDVASIVD